MTKIIDIIRCLEELAPISLQESYDNCGLLVGNEQAEAKGALITLDITEEVILEAEKLGFNLIVAHHPIIFKGLKKITGKNYVERCIILAIQKNIALYVAHTNLDNVIKDGVNGTMAKKLGLKNISPLMEKSSTLKKLTTFIPTESTDLVMRALHEAGAGNIGEYSECSFRITGNGFFTPSAQANPSIGKALKPETVEENRIEVIFPFYLEQKVMSALQKSHPYEEVAHFLHTLDNKNQELGSGIIGELETEIDSLEFLNFLKKTLNLDLIRHTALCKKTIKKVAYCGGSGSFLLSNAKAQKADIFITADFKYHDFFDAENQIIIADIGHYESEIHIKELFFDVIRNKFLNFALELSKVNTNPIKYYH